MSARRLWILVSCGALAVSGSSALAEALTNAVNEAIPPLRPPRPELPPGFWEQNGFWVLAGLVVVLTLVVAAASIIVRPRAAPEAEPAAKARHQLEPLRAAEETGPVLSRISQAVKEYFRDTFALPRHQLTTAEFCSVVATDQRVGPELASGVSDFLRRCDTRKFAPQPPVAGTGAAAEALKLVDAGELRRQALAAPVRDKAVSA